VFPGGRAAATPSSLCPEATFRRLTPSFDKPPLCGPAVRAYLDRF
jgi:hypothetical protein